MLILMILIYKQYKLKIILNTLTIKFNHYY